NAAEARAVLAGVAGPVRDAVILNAAGAMVAHAGLASAAEWLPAWADGPDRAARAGDTGAADQPLARGVRFGQQLCGAVSACRRLLGGEPGRPCGGRPRRPPARRRPRREPSVVAVDTHQPHPRGAEPADDQRGLLDQRP